MSAAMGIYFDNGWFGVWFLFSVALGTIAGEMDANKNNHSLLNNIHVPENQLELIDRIKSGKIIFVQSTGLVGILFGPAYYKRIWKAKGLPIVFWHEDPGFSSFSYLKINGKEVIDELKYGSAIGLTIQDPKTDWVKK